MTEGIGHRGQMALGVIGVGGDVRNIRARAVRAFHQAQAVIAVAPGTCRRLSARGDQCCSQGQ